VTRLGPRVLAFITLLGVSTMTEGMAESTEVVASSSACATGTTARALTARFAAGIGPLIGLDYQRAFRLPGGRRLWVSHVQPPGHPSNGRCRSTAPATGPDARAPAGW
jgi:hypothetical protein